METDENGIIKTYRNYVFNALGSTDAPAPESHEAHFKALTNVPRSMLALTTCNAKVGGEYGSAYMCVLVRGSSLSRFSAIPGRSAIREDAPAYK